MRSVVELKPHTVADVAGLADVLSIAMLHNPIHLAVFGSTNDQARVMQKRLFNVILQEPSCNLVVACADGKIVGVMNYYLPGQCQLSAARTLSMMPKLAMILRGRLFRALRWKQNWGKHDPQKPHLHFGPLAVLPSVQGHGIGSRLLRHFCRIADHEGLGAYLETDKKENVVLYEKFGFTVIDQDVLFGVTNWFMWRDPSEELKKKPGTFLRSLIPKGFQYRTGAGIGIGCQSPNDRWQRDAAENGVQAGTLGPGITGSCQWRMSTSCGTTVGYT